MAELAAAADATLLQAGMLQVKQEEQLAPAAPQ
jgi:hypothetical protein